VTHLWDNGTNAVDELDHVMQVRAAALKNFSEKNIREGLPLATLEEALVPIYMFHRYQVEAAVKVVGGLNYTYAVRGDGQKPLERVTPAEQRRALSALLRTLSPDALVLPEPLLALIPPRPFGYGRSRELFRGRTGLVFDAVAPAETAANFTLALLLNAERAARLVEHRARDAQQPSLGEVLDALLAATWKAPAKQGMAGEVQRAINSATLYQLMALAANERTPAQVRAIVAEKLESLRASLAAQARTAVGADQRAHFAYGAAQIKKFQDDPKQIALPRPLDAPDGPPIGSMNPSLCDWHRWEMWEM
jgi:hypothetical protein